MREHQIRGHTEKDSVSIATSTSVAVVSEMRGFKREFVAYFTVYRIPKYLNHAQPLPLLSYLKSMPTGMLAQACQRSEIK